MTRTTTGHRQPHPSATGTWGPPPRTPATSPASRRGRLSTISLALAAVTVGSGLVGPYASPAAAAALPSVRATASDALGDSYGVIVHLTYGWTPYRDHAAVAARLKDLGVRHVRTRLSDTPSQWAGLRALTSAGIGLNLILGAPDGKVSPARLVDIAARNLPLTGIDSFEGANEYNLSRDPQWAPRVRAHQQALYTAVKANPKTAHIPVLMPSLGLHRDYDKLGDMSRMADFGNDHLYPGGRQPSVKVDKQMSQVRGVVGNKPIMFTETGYHNAMNTQEGHLPTTEAAAGVYTPKLLLEYFARGVKRTYNYELVDQGPDPSKTHQEANFGLVRNDLSPKPAFTAMKNLLALTADPGPAFTPGTLQYKVDGAPADLRQVLLQKRNGTFQLALWRDVAAYDPRAEKAMAVAPVNVTVQLAGPTPTRVHRPSTSATAAASTTASSVTLPLAGELTVLELGGAPARPGAESSPIFQHYAALGGTGSFLGAPTSAETDVAGGRQQSFAGGDLFWSPKTGVHEVRGAILSRYRALGGPAVLGFPTADEVSVGAGKVSAFTGGRVYWSAATGTHAVRGPVLTRYLSLGGPEVLGFPTVDELPVPGGQGSSFVGGDIYWSPATGAHVLYGVIKAAWLARGGASSPLGLPKTDEYAAPQGRRSTFVGGTILWNSTTGGVTVTLR